jgi:hypothetical protein
MTCYVTCHLPPANCQLPSDLTDDLPHDLPSGMPCDLPCFLSRDLPCDLPHDLPRDLPHDLSCDPDMAKRLKEEALSLNRLVWQGVSMDSLKFHLSLPCPTLLRPAGGPPPKWPYGCFGGGSPAGRAACGRLLPPWIPHAVWA